MAVRTTLAKVRALISPQGITIDDIELGLMLTAASTYIDSTLADQELDDALLIEIETYLAAHFTALREIRAGISSQRADDASVTYTVGQLASNELMKSTHFGQVALVLDTTGTLANVNGQRARLQVL